MEFLNKDRSENKNQINLFKDKYSEFKDTNVSYEKINNNIGLIKVGNKALYYINNKGTIVLDIQTILKSDIAHNKYIQELLGFSLNDNNEIVTKGKILKKERLKADTIKYFEIIDTLNFATIRDQLEGQLLPYKKSPDQECLSQKQLVDLINSKALRLIDFKKLLANGWIDEKSYQNYKSYVTNLLDVQIFDERFEKFESNITTKEIFLYIYEKDITKEKGQDYITILEEQKQISLQKQNEICESIKELKNLMA